MRLAEREVLTEADAADCCSVAVRVIRPSLPLRSAAGWEQKSWNVADTAAT